MDLPYGVTASDVIERRDRLSGGLRRPLGCVYADVHAGHLVLWVGDEDMSKAKPVPWPLRKATKAHSVFASLPFGTDQRGRPVGIDLMYSNVLIGALPGAGRTFALRVLVLGAAMDPLCELRVYELKGSGDLDAVEAISHHFGSGADDDTAAECVPLPTRGVRRARDQGEDHQTASEGRQSTGEQGHRGTGRGPGVEAAPASVRDR